MRWMSLGVEPRFINKYQFLTHVGHLVEHVIVSLLEESRLVPLARYLSDRLPGDVDGLECLLNGGWSDRDVKLLTDMLGHPFEGSRRVVLQ